MHVLLVYLFTCPQISHSSRKIHQRIPIVASNPPEREIKKEKLNIITGPGPYCILLVELTLKLKSPEKQTHQETPKESKKSSLPPFFTAAVPIALPPPTLPFIPVPADDVTPLGGSPKESQKSLRSGPTAFLDEGVAPASPLDPPCDGGSVEAGSAGPSMNLENCSAAPFVPVWIFWAREEAVRRA